MVLNFGQNRVVVKSCLAQGGRKPLALASFSPSVARSLTVSLSRHCSLPPRLLFVTRLRPSHPSPVDSCSRRCLSSL